MTSLFFYVGKNEAGISRFRELLGNQLTVVADTESAIARMADRPQDGAAVLYEEGESTHDLQQIGRLHKLFPGCPVILIAGELSEKSKIAYLRSGVGNTVPPTLSAEEWERRIVPFLEQQEWIRVALRKSEAPDGGGKNRREIRGMDRYRIPLWKRTFDIVFSVLAILMLSPLLIVTALAIRIESRGRVIYKSKRVGSNYLIFDFLKFRSMYTDADRRLADLAALNQSVSSSYYRSTSPSFSVRKGPCAPSTSCF